MLPLHPQTGLAFLQRLVPSQEALHVCLEDFWKELYRHLHMVSVSLSQFSLSLCLLAENESGSTFALMTVITQKYQQKPPARLL